MIKFILAKVMGTAKKVCNPLARVPQLQQQCQCTGRAATGTTTSLFATSPRPPACLPIGTLCPGLPPPFAAVLCLTLL